MLITHLAIVEYPRIDMAAADSGDDPVTPKGATGYGVRLLTDFALKEIA